MSQKLYLVLLVAVFLVGGAFSYFVLPQSALGGPLVSPAVKENGSSAVPLTGVKQLVAVNPSEPKNQVCPLNGLSYTATEKSLWDKRRPLVIMIENHDQARPQSGLSSADVVYESVAEGAITRFMAVFYCDIASVDLSVGPVRSARTYFLDWASEYGKYPLYTHVGGANTPNKANALGQIKDYGWYGGNDLSQFGLSIHECWRDDSILKTANHVTTVPTEHTMQCSTEALYKVAAARGFTDVTPKGDSWTKFFTPWKFGTTPDSGPGKPATVVDFDFWKDYAAYHVKWTFDSSTKTYKRENGGNPQIDWNNKKQLETGTVIVQYETEVGPIDEEKHMLYGTIGSGNALIFSQGQAFQATWSKKDRLSRTLFKDAKGKDFQFVPGKIWIENLAKNAPVSYN